MTKHAAPPANLHRITALFLSLLALDATAQDVESMSLEDLLNLPIETFSRRVQPLAWAPAYSIVVTAEQIKARRYVNLKDLLQDLPGVSVYDNYSEASDTQVSIRGNAGNNQFVVLQDGERISSPTGEPFAVSDNYPLIGIKQVEILFGPASALYGADALSGIINLTREKGGLAPSAEAQVSYGTDGYLHGGVHATGQLGEHLAIRLGGHLHGANNPDLSRAYPSMFDMSALKNPFSGEVISPRDNPYSNRSRSYSFYAQAEFDHKTRITFDERAYASETSLSVRPEYTLYGPQNGLRWRTISGKHGVYLLPSLKSETELSYATLDAEADYAFRNFFSGFEDVYKVIANQTLTVRQQLSYDLTELHHLIGGFTWANTHSRPSSGDLSAKPDPSRPLSSQGFVVPGTTLPLPIAEVDYASAGGYAQVQSQWLPQLSTTVGARYDVDSRFGGTFNPRLGIVFQPVAELTSKLLYGEAFLAPSTYYEQRFFGAFDGVDPTTGQPRASYYHLPNDGLQPKKARTLELVQTALIQKKLLVEASAYLSGIERGIETTVRPGPEDFAGGVVETIERYESIGSATLYGGNLSLSYQGMVEAIEVEPWLRYSVSLGEARDVPGAPVTELAENTAHQLKGGVTLRYQRFSFTPRFRWNGVTTHSQPNPENPRERLHVPGSLLVDATVVADRVLGNLSLTLDVRNVLDARHYAPGTPGAVNFVGSPQNPRQVFLEASYAL